MGFAQELKEFTAAFATGYKAAAPTTADAQLRKDAREQAEKKTEEELRASATTGRATAPAIAVGGESGGGYNPKGKTPTFASHQDFINRIAPVAMEVAEQTGLDPKLVVAQAAHESGWGKSAPGNNLFGIKAHGAAAGPALATTEVVGGKPVRTTARFRTYATPEDSVRGYGEFLKTNPRYRGVMSATSLDEQIDAMGKSGYATDPEYAAKLRAITRSIRLPGEQKRAALDLDEEVPTVFAASGGLIPDTYSGDDDDAGSNPAVRDAKERGAASATVDPSIIPEMIDSGMKYIQRTLGLDGAALPQASPRTTEAARALAHNVGAPRPEEVEELVRTVDPEGKLPRDQQIMAGWSKYYEHFSKKGDLEKAARGASAALMYSKQVSQRAGALALAALDKGDVEGAANAMKAAYDYIPDGVAIRVKSAGPGGVEYETVDLKGSKPVFGKATPEEMRQIASGMMDGSEWFQAVSAARVPVDKAAQRQAAETKAAAEFEGTLAPEQLDDYRATLSSEQLEKFNKLPRQKQQQYLNAFRTDRKAAFDEFKFDERMARAAQTGDRKEALDIFKFATRYGMWEKTREQVLTENEKRLAQKEVEEAGRNRRQELSFEERRKLQQERDKAILSRRTKTLDGAGVKLTAREAAEGRRTGAIDAAEQERLDRVEQAIPLTPGGSEGAMEERRRRQVEAASGPIRAGAGFGRIPTAERAVDDSDVAEIDRITKEDPAWKTAGLSPVDTQWARRIASEIKGAGGAITTNQDAVNAVAAALDPKYPDPVVLPGGEVRIGRLPPVKMSESSLMQLAMLRERSLASARPAYREGAGGAAPRSALKLTPAAERRQQREEAARASETTKSSALQLKREAERLPGGRLYERLRQELGADWRPNMTIGDMKRALADLHEEQTRDPSLRRQRYDKNLRRALDERYSR